MRIQESEYRSQKKNNVIAILATDSWLLMLRSTRPMYDCNLL